MTETRRLALRVHDDDRQRWQQQATAEGLTLSEWIRSRCNGPAVERPTLPPTAADLIVSPPVATAPKRAKGTTKAQPASCPPHPRAARVEVNASLGLFRCGACGNIVR